MGVAYGAASLWQWRLHPDEPGNSAYFVAEGAGWKEALEFEGSRYVGLVGKILDDLPITRAGPCWDVSANTRDLSSGRPLRRLRRAWWALDVLRSGGPGPFQVLADRPRTGAVLKSGKRPPDYVPIEFDRYEPSILICCETTPPWVGSVGDHVE